MGIGLFGSSSNKRSTTNETTYTDESTTTNTLGGDGSVYELGDTSNELRTGKNSTINQTVTDHGSVLGAFDLASDALSANNESLNTSLVFADSVNNNALTLVDNVTAGSNDLARDAIFAGVDTVDLTATALQTANDNMTDTALYVVDFAESATDRLSGSTERMGELFADSTISVFDSALDEVSHLSQNSSDMAYNLSNDFMSGVTGIFGDSIEAVTDQSSLAVDTVAANSMYVNDSILSLARDNSDAIESAYETANNRFMTAMEEKDAQNSSMLSELFMASTSNSNSQFNTALDQINATTQEAYRLVEESAKSESERTSETLIKFGIGGAVLLGIAVVWGRAK